MSEKIDDICKKDYNWNLSTCICQNGKYLKYIASNSVTVSNEFVINDQQM